MVLTHLLVSLGMLGFDQGLDLTGRCASSSFYILFQQCDDSPRHRCASEPEADVAGLHYVVMEKIVRRSSVYPSVKVV